MYEFDTLAVIGEALRYEDENDAGCETAYCEESTPVEGVRDEARYDGAIAPPIFQTSTFEGGNRHSYSRISNPTRELLERELAILEGGRHAFAFSSGLAAVNAIFSMLKSGDRVIISDDLYGGSYRQATQIFEKFGIEFDFIDTTEAENIENALKKRAKMVFIESPSNPMMLISPIAEIASLCRKSGAIFVVDNTFLTPYFQNPLALGADVVLHSATKYLSGHHDVIAGALITNDFELASQLRLIVSTLGNALSPFDCWLTLRGLRTLSMRMEKHSQNAQAVSSFLKNHEAIEKVVCPEITSQSRGIGGIVTFSLKSAKGIERLRKGGKIIRFAESLGGFRSLISHPATQTHASVPIEKRMRLGITERLFRLSCGLENERDIIADLSEMLSFDS